MDEKCRTLKIKEKPKWYEWYICKVWRANYAMNQNDAQRHFALKWGLKTKYVKSPHYCSFSDRNHKAVMDFEEGLKNAPKSKPIVFKNVDEFIKDLNKKDNGIRETVAAPKSDRAMEKEKKDGKR